MKEQYANSSDFTQVIPASGSALPRDYSYAAFLENHGIRYQTCGDYLLVGDVRRMQGWALQISVIKQEMAALLEMLLPLLAQEEIPYMIPLNKAIHGQILDGSQGLARLGKVMTIYPAELQAVYLAQRLIMLTAAFKGPKIPTATHLGACIYARYDHFNTIIQHADSHDQMRQLTSDQRKRLQKESYTVPYILPEGLAWPFSMICSPLAVRPPKLIAGRYLPLEVLKNDAKGKVIKCLSLKSWLNIHWCILKQGNQHMTADDAGRDVKDRLLWQYELHQSLAAKVSLPKVYECFEWDGNTYLVMEYLEGASLTDRLYALSQGNSWASIVPQVKIKMLDYLLQAIGIVEKLHENGYVHRDLNLQNFLVARNEHLVAIDLELCYNFLTNQPMPPFTLGTPGYMSPEQVAVNIPGIQEDLYGIGALMVKLLTGQPPTRFSTGSPGTLLANLDFFIQDKAVVQLICTCLAPAPDLRPQLTVIRSVIENYRLELLNPKKNHVHGAVNFVKAHNELCQHVITKGLQALESNTYTDRGQIWYSKSSLGDQNTMANELMGTSCHTGLHDGISGVLYTMAIAHGHEYPVGSCKPVIAKNWEYLKTESLDRLDFALPGLFYGAAGNAIAITALIKSELIHNREGGVGRIKECLSLGISQDLNLATGVAGQGVALMHCHAFLQWDQSLSLIAHCTAVLLQTQQADGSWLLKQPGTVNKGIKLPGFSYGIAGITYYLLEYAIAFRDEPAKRSAIRALDYLLKQRIKQGGHQIWQMSPKNKSVSPWLEDGFSGVALTFIKAYQYLGDDRYKEAATAALMSHPLQISSNFQTVSSGIAGLGEIYLEACRIFKDDEWQHRADWIAGTFLHTAVEHSDGSVFWLDGHDTKAYSGLMSGNSGILHFLMRYDLPDKISLPLFNFSL